MALLRLAIVLLLLLTHEACSTTEGVTDNKQLSEILTNDSRIPGTAEAGSASAPTEVLSRVRRQYLYPLNKGRRNYRGGAARIVISGAGYGTGRDIRISRGYGYYDYAG